MKAAKQKTPPQPGVSKAANGGSRWWVYVAVLAVALLTLVEVYWPSMHGPFVFDDEYLAFRDPSFLEKGLTGLNPISRPLLHLSYWLNLQFAGPEETFGFHLWNVLFHLANGVLMFLALSKFMAMAGESEARRRIVAAFAAAVFLLHPVNTEAVSYIAGRSESFSLLWFLSAFVLFLYKREDGVGWGASAGVLVLFGAAFLSKEHAAVLPVLLLWTDWYFAAGKPAESVRRNWRLYAPIVAIGAAGFALVWRVLRDATTVGFAMKDLPWHDYLYTQWRAIWIYLKLAVLPVGLNADYDFAISRSPLDHGAVFGLIGLIALFGAAFFYRKRFPLVFFGTVVFFLLLAPTSSIVPIKDPVAERRLYLPFLGLLLVACDLLRRWNAAATTQGTVMAVVLATLGFLTNQRSHVWSDSIALWTDTTSKSPGNSRAHFQLAMSHYLAGQCETALAKFADAERTSKKEDYSLYLDWGLAFDCLNQHANAEAKFRQAAEIENTGHVRALIGMALARQNKLGAALEELDQAERLKPDYDMTYVYKGKVYLLMNEPARAEGEYNKALSVNPNSDAARQALAELAQHRGLAR